MGKLSKFVESGRVRGAMLAGGRESVLGGISTTLREAEAQLDEVERRLAASMALWQREWATMVLRGIVKELAREEESPERTKIFERALSLRAMLKARDAEELGPLQAQLERGEYRAEDLKRDLASRPAHEHDAFVERLLKIDEVPGRQIDLTDEMIHYLPSPFQVIVELIAELREGDVLFDLGCGLGKVAMLAAWLSPAKVIGIDLEPAYVDFAAARARACHIEKLELLAADAREVDYSSGTIFYLYDPFRGEILETVLAKLEKVAEHHPIRIATRGRSTDVIGQKPWLEKQKAHPSGLAIYHHGA